MYIKPIMWIVKPNLLALCNDLGEYIQEMGFDIEQHIDVAEFVELWELILEWQKDVQK